MVSAINLCNFSPSPPNFLFFFSIVITIYYYYYYCYCYSTDLNFPGVILYKFELVVSMDLSGGTGRSNMGTWNLKSSRELVVGFLTRPLNRQYVLVCTPI